MLKPYSNIATVNHQWIKNAIKQKYYLQKIAKNLDKK